MPAGKSDATLSTIVADPTECMPDGTTTTDVTVSLVDSEEDAIGAGHLIRVSISQNPAGVTLSASEGYSDESGEFAFTAKSTTIHTSDAKTAIQAIDVTDGVILAADAEIDFFPIMDQTYSSIVADPAQAEPDETDTVDITVTVLDANEDPIEGLQVSLAATDNDTGVVIDPAHDDTDANGEVAFTATSTTAHTGDDKTIFQATDDDNSIDLAATCTGDFRMLVDASESTVEASAESGTCDGVDEVTITVTCLDSEGDPVPSVPVTLTASTNGTGAVINGEDEEATVTADADGVAVFVTTCSGTTHGGRGGTKYTAVAGSEETAITDYVTVLWYGTLAVSVSPIAFCYDVDTPTDELASLTQAVTITGTPEAGSAVTATESANWISADATFDDSVAGSVAIAESQLPTKGDGEPIKYAGTVTFSHTEYTSLVVPVIAERYRD